MLVLGEGHRPLDNWDNFTEPQKALLSEVRRWLMTRGVVPVRTGRSGKTQALQCSAMIMRRMEYTADDAQEASTQYLIKDKSAEHWRTKVYDLIQTDNPVKDDCDGYGWLTILLCWAIGVPMEDVDAAVVSSETNRIICEQYPGRKRQIDHFIARFWCREMQQFLCLGDTWDQHRTEQCPIVDTRHMMIMAKPMHGNGKGQWLLPPGVDKLDIEMFASQASRPLPDAQVRLG